MRSRNEVLTVESINDRIRELEAQQAASEPVAWALYHDECERPWTVELVKRDPSDVSAGTRIVPLYAHPSAAVVTDAQIDAAAKALFLDDTISHGMTWDDASPRLVKEFKAYARIALTAARERREEDLVQTMEAGMRGMGDYMKPFLTGDDEDTHPTTPTRGSDE